MTEADERITIMKSRFWEHWREEGSSTAAVLCELGKYVERLKEIVYHDLEMERREDFSEYIDTMECMYHFERSEEYRKGVYDSMVLKKIIEKNGK